MTPSALGAPLETSRIPKLKSLAKVGLSLAFLSAAASFLNSRSQAQGGVSVIWLSNGFLVAVLLCCKRRQWPSFILLGFLIDFAVNLTLTTPVTVSMYFSLCNMIEVVVASSLMYSTIAENPDLTQPHQLRSFLLSGTLLAPFIASLMAVYGLQVWLGIPFLHSFQFWFTADVLGVATITPLYLSFHHRREFSPRSPIETTGLFFLLVVVSIFVFYVATVPLIWVVLLFLILLGARVGFTGSALGLLAVTFIGGMATVSGHGPLAFDVHGSISAKILMFQVFIIITMLALYLTEVAMAKAIRMRLSLEASETRFRLLTEASRDVIVLAGLDGERKYVSPAATELLGWSQEELIGQTYRQFTHPDDVPLFTRLLEDCLRGADTNAVSFRAKKKDGSFLWLESNIRLFNDVATGQAAGFVYVLRDISERKLAEDRLQDAFHTVEKLALVDGLTGVANRRLMDETLGREWMRAIRDGTYLSLILIDVDFFKAYNDLYGHLAGDACLQRLAAAIQDVIRRPPDLLARYGGEEFVIILPNTPNSGAQRMAATVLSLIDQCSLAHDGSPYGKVTASLGCATMIATLEHNPTALLRAADEAMYRAKTNGRNQVYFAPDQLLATDLLIQNSSLPDPDPFPDPFPDPSPAAPGPRPGSRIRAAFTDIPLTSNLK